MFSFFFWVLPRVRQPNPFDVMNYQNYLNSLQLQKAMISDELEQDPSFMISPEKHNLLTMLGSVEMQINIVRKRIITNDIISPSDR